MVSMCVVLQLPAGTQYTYWHGLVCEGRQSCWCCWFQVDLLQARLCQMLGRSLYIDEHTAKFYLEDSGGDIKAAMEAFGERSSFSGASPVTHCAWGQAVLR